MPAGIKRNFYLEEGDYKFKSPTSFVRKPAPPLVYSNIQCIPNVTSWLNRERLGGGGDIQSAIGELPWQRTHAVAPRPAKTKCERVSHGLPDFILKTLFLSPQLAIACYSRARAV